MMLSGKLDFRKALVGDGGRFFFLFSFGILLCIFGMTRDSMSVILAGLWRIAVEPDYLVTDYIEVGGMGAAFMNSGLLVVLFTGVLVLLKVRIRGISIAAVFIVAGFALFGKNLLNVWFILAGVWLYAKVRGEPFLQYVYIAFFGTSLAPIVSQIMFGVDLPIVVRIVLGAAAGLGAGFVLPPLAAALLPVHHGFNLYNMGFTSGMVGTIAVSLFKSHGFVVERRMIWSTGNDTLLASLLVVFCVSLIAVGFRLNDRSAAGLSPMWRQSGKLLADFVDMFDFPPTMMNMGLNGLIGIAYLLLVGCDFNGPTIGGLFTIMGFSAMGKTPRNIVPIMMGTMLGGLTNTWSLTDPVVQLTALFSTTLAPIAGGFGWWAGVIAGYVHSSVVLYVGVLHSGFNLYNNGFAGGLVAAVLVPLLEAFRRRSQR